MVRLVFLFLYFRKQIYERIIIRNLFSSFFFCFFFVFFLFFSHIQLYELHVVSYSSYRDEKSKRNWCVEDSGRMGNGKWYWEITEFHLLLPRTRASIQQLRSSCARYLPPCTYTPYVTIYIYRSKDEKVSRCFVLQGNSILAKLVYFEEIFFCV